MDMISDLGSPEIRTFGFTPFAHNFVLENDQMAKVVEVANEKLYNLHTRVAIK